MPVGWSDAKGKAGENSCVIGIYAEQQWNAPQTGQADQAVNQAAEQGERTSEAQSNQVQFKQSDAAPVDGTDDY